MVEVGVTQLETLALAGPGTELAWGGVHRAA